MTDSLFLLDHPSAIEGAARVFDFQGSLTQYNVSPSGEDADNAALWADWELIANDLKAAAQRYAKEQGSVATAQSR